MKILRFGMADVAKGNLILVNPTHPFRGEGRKEALVSVGFAAHILLESQTAKVLREIMAFLGCGHEIVPVSGYRTMREQQTIYMNSLHTHGKDFTRKYIAVPGCSEHQTGFAVDLAENRGTIDFIRPDFPYTGICGRFRDLSVQHGFIERYPYGCEQVTNISHEPWHFRYVGYPHSEIMQEKSLTLEEYTDYIKQFPQYGTHLRFKRNQCGFEIFYIPVRCGRKAITEIPGNVYYEVSGNNVDGIIVTLRRNL